MTFDFDDPKYYDVEAVEKELERVTELCDGCRRCYRLCAPFDFMLDDCVDKNDGDVSRITSAEYRKIVDLCWQCKLCFNHCPYTPPHKWGIDFPRLMLRAKAARARAEGVTLQDRALPQPTCSYVLKNEYLLLVPGEDARRVAAATMDIFEYLAARKAEGTLDIDFGGRAQGRVSYQMPCHLRAQNMGFKTRDVLQTIPGTTVSVIEKCTAMDGTWGMKKENFKVSMQFAKRAAHEMEAAKPDVFSTDCSLSALQIEEASGRKPVHPIALLREAYGIPEER